MFELVWPHADFLDSYAGALARGWGPNTLAPEASARQELARIAADPKQFVASLVDLEAAGEDIELPDGQKAKRLPGYRRWLIERQRTGVNAGAEFVGSMNLRFVPGCVELPPHVLGHVGYSVVPWKQRRGAASFGLRRLLDDALRLGHLDGLAYVAITTYAGNLASQGVITKAGGVYVSQFVSAVHGDREATNLYHLALSRPST